MKHKYNNQVERLWKLDTVTDSSEHAPLVNQTREGMRQADADSGESDADDKCADDDGAGDDETEENGDK